METFLLVLLLIFPDHTETEKRPVTVPICKTVDGVRVEDSTCGIKACMRIGRERAAVVWGQVPELDLGFKLTCSKQDQSTTQGAEPAPGHSGMNWQ